MIKNKNLNFSEQCYALIRTIPAGKVVSYQSIAHALGCKAYQAVGNAMNHNPDLINTPCHRVIKQNGEIGGYINGTAAKIRLLEQEGIEIENGKVVEPKRYWHQFKQGE